MNTFSHDIEHPISIPCEQVKLDGLLHVPSHAEGLIIFAHGSGSGRFSPRNQMVAHQLQQAQMATLLFDLLTPEEDVIDEHTAQFRFDIPFLAERLVAVTQWVEKHPVLKKLPVGYFGASTGAGAALVAAARMAHIVKAVVSRGGRPDLAGESLAYVNAATLLIVGSLDEPVILLNKEALSHLSCVKKLEIVSGATHLFEESGKLEEVADLAKAWFGQYLF